MDEVEDVGRAAGELYKAHVVRVSLPCDEVRLEGGTSKLEERKAANGLRTKMTSVVGS